MASYTFLHMAQKLTFQFSDFNFCCHDCHPRRATVVNQVTMIDVNRTLYNISVTVPQETKTKCFPVIIARIKEPTSTQLSHCHCYAALFVTVRCKISDWRTKHRNLPGRPNPPVIAIRYCFDSRESNHLQHICQ